MWVVDEPKKYKNFFTTCEWYKENRLNNLICYLIMFCLTFINNGDLHLYKHSLLQKTCALCKNSIYRLVSSKNYKNLSLYRLWTLKSCTNFLRCFIFAKLYVDLRTSYKIKIQKHAKMKYYFRLYNYYMRLSNVVNQILNMFYNCKIVCVFPNFAYY